MGDSAYRQHACAMLTVRLDDLLIVLLLLRKHCSRLAPPCARRTESMATSCSLREQRRGFGFGTCAILNPRTSLPISTARVCEWVSSSKSLVPGTMWGQQNAPWTGRTLLPMVRFHILRNARIENVGKYQSCMVSKLRIIWKQLMAR